MARRKKLLELVRIGAMKAKGQTSDLLKVLQSEIDHELSSPPFQNDQSGPPGDFTLEWDAPHSEDILLRKKCETGEEVTVSALLKKYPRIVGMKVCVKKPGLGSLLLFDCNGYGGSHSPPDFDINFVRYLRSKSSTGSRCYTGPLFCDLDPDLQAAFKEYLDARLGGSLMNFLNQHMHRKEQDQYVNWLQKLQETVSQVDSSSPS